MGNACSNCTSNEEENQFEVNQSQETGNFNSSSGNQVPNNGSALQPQRVAIQSQRLEELPNRFKGGQYVLDNSTGGNSSHRVFSNDVSDFHCYAPESS